MVSLPSIAFCWRWCRARNLSFLAPASTPIEDYGRSGYVYYLPLFSDLHGTVPYTPDEARAIIQRDLVQQRWTDEATRLLVIDFNVLNLNLGNAMTVRFVFEASISCQ